MVVSSRSPAVIWHDLECGGYRADLPLWRRLAAREATGKTARVLEIGAGTGRVALDLARRGHRVTALDRNSTLLAALVERAGGLPVETVCADAREFALASDDRYDLCLVPMQTLQLLRGASERAALFACAKRHLRQGGVLACAIVSEVDGFDSRAGAPGPAPERTRVGATMFMSRAVRVARRERFVRIERERLVFDDGAEQTQQPIEHDLIELEILDTAGLARELEAAALSAERPRAIAATEEHSASEVVIARV